MIHYLSRNKTKTAMTDLARRKGIIKFQDNFIEDAHNLNEKILPALFSRLFPIYIQRNSAYDYNEYYCVSPNFDVIDDGCEIPEYDCTIDDFEGDPKITFQKL